MENSGQEATGENKSESTTTENPAVDAGNPSLSASTIVKRWKTEDSLRKGTLILRAAALVFSLLSFIIMASDQHGDWMNFDKYQEFRYILAIAILATLYTGCQVFLGIHNLITRKELISRRTVSFIDFSGDQIVAYLLISAGSAAAPITNRMREGIDNAFTDALAASISMAFFAFAVLALSALISGYKLSHQSYI